MTVLQRFYFQWSKYQQSILYILANKTFEQFFSVIKNKQQKRVSVPINKKIYRAVVSLSNISRCQFFVGGE